MIASTPETASAAGGSRPESAGLFVGLRQLADGLLATVQDRLELVSVELHEDRLRLVQVFIWLSAAIFAGMMALTFASLTLVYLCWQGARLAALGGLALLYTGVLVAIAAALRRHLARLPKPFTATLREIGRDRACIRPES